jgi:uncharacterized protein YdeI (YjbR/CyaY-like superfamily)
MTSDSHNEALYFSSPFEWRQWLEAHHAMRTEVIVGFYKKSTGLASMTWAESVDEALCFGWIDGVRRRVDDERYTIRFTPRRPGSTWSRVNIERVQELMEEGHMTPAGLAAFEARTDAKSGIYSHEQDGEIAFEPEQEARFRANEGAWAFFEARPASYRRAATGWVVSAKREVTRERRLAQLIADSEAGQTVKHLTPPRSR